jgi:hypothetical protein
MGKEEIRKEKKIKTEREKGRKKGRERKGEGRERDEWLVVPVAVGRGLRAQGGVGSAVWGRPLCPPATSAHAGTHARCHSTHSQRPTAAHSAGTLGRRMREIREGGREREKERRKKRERKEKPIVLCPDEERSRVVLCC